MSSFQLFQGDCRERLAAMQPESIDACITDPPYHLTTVSRGGSAREPGTGPFGRHRVGEKGFMGKTWDGGGIAFDPATWAAVYRVLKPGARVLAFGGSRTHHRIWCAIEDAGFVLEDTIMWLYGSGFPKHRSKLKPAYEPICVARKGKVSELNIDACRIGDADTRNLKRGGANDFPHEDDAWTPKPRLVGSESGRWPANVVLTHHEECGWCTCGHPESLHPPSWDGFCFVSHAEPIEGSIFTARVACGCEGFVDAGCHPDCPVRLLDEQSGELVSGANPTRRGSDKFRSIYHAFPGQSECTPARGFDVGGASRFYYCAKPDKAERHGGLEGMERKPGGSVRHGNGSIGSKQGRDAARFNHHPTVKPLDLMRWLVRLVTPAGGTVLDPFTGSGTTGVAAIEQGFHFIGIELNADYAEIARRRITNAPLSLGLGA